MKKIRELFKSRVGKLVVYLLLAYPVFAAAQIGYRYVRGTGTPGTAACWDSAFVLEDCGAGSSISGSGTTNTVSKFTAAGAIGDSSITDNGVNIVFAPGTFTTIDGLEVTGSFTSNANVELAFSSSNSTVNLGNNDGDNITINGPAIFNVIRNDFNQVTSGYFTSSTGWAASAVTDTSENIMHFFGGQIGVIGYRWEQAFAGTVDFINNGYLDLDVDDTDNDGIDIIFNAATSSNTVGTYWDEDTSSTSYCEISLLIADVSEVDILHFGWALGGAHYQDAGAYTSGNTYSYFVLSDNAGDLDIVTKLNAGAEGNDDTGITWTDGQEKVLRIVVAADSVSFSVNGTPVTQTNAVLNYDDTDRLTCGFGYINATGDTTPAPGIKINYVEIGVSQ